MGTRLIVQVYAFTDRQTALAALEAGVDHIGFVAGQYGQVHGELSFERARLIAQSLGARGRSIALTMATDVEEILRMAHAVQPDFVHLSTDLDAVDPHALRRLRDEWQGEIGLIKAIPVGGPESLELIEPFAEWSDYLLLDTKVEGLPGVGATGRTHDWSVSRLIAARYPGKVLLAGGLGPDNVAEAIRTVLPAGVDSNTSTNVQGDPVTKDLGRIRAFVQAARRTAGELAR